MHVVDIIGDGAEQVGVGGTQAPSQEVGAPCTLPPPQQLTPVIRRRHSIFGVIAH